jgi:metal-dependent amidase/aminoacylase/carboxypeptidase family protein
LIGEEELMELETETEETEAVQEDAAPATQEAPVTDGTAPAPGGDDFTNMPTP